MTKKKPSFLKEPRSENARIKTDPDSYLKQMPVWRFSDFDWESPWGHNCCVSHIANLRNHIEKHLSSFESMTWSEILRASGGRRNGTNSHPIARDEFKKEVQERLVQKNILSDELFSLRLDAGTRIYGVRETNCLRIVFFDPHHKDKKLCAYQFTD
jgi:hypothetical protein